MFAANDSVAPAGVDDPPTDDVVGRNGSPERVPNTSESGSVFFVTRTCRGAAHTGQRNKCLMWSGATNLGIVRPVFGVVPLAPVALNAVELRHRYAEENLREKHKEP